MPGRPRTVPLYCVLAMTSQMDVAVYGPFTTEAAAHRFIARHDHGLPGAPQLVALPILPSRDVRPWAAAAYARFQAARNGGHDG